MFILDPERDEDVTAAFKRYEAYLKENAERFPPSAYQLATSDWYYDFSDHKSPHDAWLESLIILEATETRAVSLTIKLLGAYHDGHIEFHYPAVFAYRVSDHVVGPARRDWRYDEFRLAEDGRLIHEIEWRDVGFSANWLIVASDVHHKWVPANANEDSGVRHGP